MARLELVRPEDLPAADARLLTEALHPMAKLPLSELDLLVIDETGKRHNGTGLEPHVIARWRAF